MAKILKYVLIILLVLVCGAFGAGYYFIKNSAFDYSSRTIEVPVNAEVTVVIDSIGIPHIIANSEPDAFFTLGYMEAAERLFQMELLRRVGSGRLSEILGPELLNADILFRSFGFEKAADEAIASWDTLPPPYANAVKAYIRGINAFIDSGKLPAEFTLIGIHPTYFRLQDIYLIAGYMSFSFAEALKTDPVLTRLFCKRGPQYLDLFNINTKNGLCSNKDTVTLSLFSKAIEKLSNTLPASPWIGSNGWVMNFPDQPNKKPLFANDTHIGYQQPAVWYEAALEWPDGGVYGHFLCGIPFPLTGHTNHHAWGLTMFENDDMNLYAEHIVGDEYQHGNEWRPLLSTKEKFKIKGQNDTLITFRYTHRGIIADAFVEPLTDTLMNHYSFWWSYLQLPPSVLEVTYTFMHAANLETFRSGAARLNAPGLNILYADTSGNIACYSAGKLPIINNSPDTRLALNGSSGKFDVTGYYDFSKNPQIENPASGYIVTANQQPYGDSLKIYGYYAPNDRYDRINKLITATPAADISSFMKIQTDNISDVQLENAKVVTALLSGKTKPGMQSTALALLNQWNGSHNITDQAPVMWYTTLSLILKNAMSDELGDKDFNTLVNTHSMKQSYYRLLSNATSPWWDNIQTKAIETRSSIVQESFEMAINQLSITFGEIENWQWGNAHTLTHQHPLGAVQPLDQLFNIGPLPAPGGIETINNSSFPLSSEGNFNVKYGPAMRNIIDLNDMANAYSIIPTGQSGQLGSDHYSDQVSTYLQGAYRPMQMLRQIPSGKSYRKIIFSKESTRGKTGRKE